MASYGQHRSRWVNKNLFFQCQGSTSVGSIFIISNYYMASSASGQDEPNHAQNFPKSHIINPLLTKFVRSRWLDIGLVLFLLVYGPRLRLGP